MTWSLNPVWPLGTIALIAIALLLAVAWSSRILASRNVASSWVARLLFLRVLATVLLLLILLRPSILLEREEPVRTDRVVLIDTSRSMGQSDTQDGATRLSSILRLLNDPDAFRDKLDAGETRWFAFDSEARPITPDDFDRLEADGGDTRIGSAIEQAWNMDRWRRGEAPGAPSAPPRILLVSDGVDRGRQTALTTAQRLGLVVDVLPPPVITTPPEPSLEISNVQYSRRLLPGSELRIQVTVRRTGLDDNTPGLLVLESEDQRLQTRRIRFEDHASEQRLILDHRPETPGVWHYRLKLETENAALEETLEDADPFDITVHVESRHHEILVMETEWRWSFRFLRRVLESDPDFVFSGFLSRGPGVFIQFGEPQRRTSLGGFPRSRAELAGFDTLVVGDVNPASLPAQLPRVMHELVVEDGKSLVIIGGPNLGSWHHHPLLAELLPVELYPDGRGPVAGPLPVRISLEGGDSPFFYAPEGASTARQWPQLPPMDQIYAPKRKKPAATILLETPTRRNEFGLLIAAAVHTVGRGQVLFIGTDTLWKWQMQGVTDSDGNTPYQVFWQQAMRALRPDRLFASPLQLWIRPEQTRVQTGQSVALHAVVEGPTSSGKLRVEGSIRNPAGEILPILFTRDASEAGRFKAQFAASEPGAYEIRAEARLDGQPTAENSAGLDVVPRPAENSPSPVNRALLDRLAAASGGRVLDPGIPESWSPPAGDGAPLMRTDHVEIDLWSTLWLILALTLILGADWVIRLMRGYV